MPHTTPASPAQVAALTAAFGRFNELSTRLSEAYGSLERRVAELNARLERASRERPCQTAQLAARLTGLLEALPAAVILVDRRGRVDRFNALAEGLFPGLRWGRRWAEVLEEDLDSRLEDDEWWLRAGVRVNVSARPLGDQGQVLVLVDVTERRHLEERLQRRERLSALGELAARLAHQLRTPLSAAVLYAGQLAAGEVQTAQRRRFATKLLARLHHTERLVADMLAFARGERFRPEPVELRTVLSEAADIVAPLFDSADATLSWDAGGSERATVLGNFAALVGVLVNVFTNAVEHAGRGVGVQVTLRAGALGHEILIADDGPGIPAGRQVQVFEPFFTTRASGTGLGLAVAHSVIVEHGGEIVCSNSDRGAHFLISLPPAANPSVADSWRQSA
jgi:two-component system sensor histidine kinase FlrB